MTFRQPLLPVHQVSLWQTVSNHRCVEVGSIPRLGSSTCLVLSWCIASLIHPSILFGSHRPRHLSQPRHRLGPRHGDRQRKQQDIPRWIREAINIRKELDKSMNRDDGCYQLSHIDDYSLSATATPGGQSFRRRQQRLPKRQQKLWI